MSLLLLLAIQKFTASLQADVGKTRVNSDGSDLKQLTSG